MRTDHEIYDLILAVARKDQRIRAVYMNGSRVNPRVPKDIFQDFDVVYVVTEIASFLNDARWIAVFGNLIMVQEPDKLDQGLGMSVDFQRSYAYLMLFQDGIRIDLHLQTKQSMLEKYGNDQLTLPLLDKDNCLPPIPSPTDTDYHIQPPTEPAFVSCTKNFWWGLQNVAKGIWRDELPYAKGMFEDIIRRNLNDMVRWWIGIKQGFEVSTGKMGKYFKHYLPERYWTMYERTYSDSHYDNFWNSIMTCELFRTLAKQVAKEFSFSYPSVDDENMTEYLKHVRTLPRAAQGIY